MRTVRVYTVVHDGYSLLDPGVGDGILTRRFRSMREATEYAQGKTVYGHSASVSVDDVPPRLADRWGI